MHGRARPICERARPRRPPRTARPSCRPAGLRLLPAEQRNLPSWLLCELRVRTATRAHACLTPAAAVRRGRAGAAGEPRRVLGRRGASRPLGRRAGDGANQQHDRRNVWRHRRGRVCAGNRRAARTVREVRPRQCDGRALPLTPHSGLPPCVPLSWASLACEADRRPWPLLVHRRSGSHVRDSSND